MIENATLPHVAIVCDLLEENWPSMDLVGEMLVQRLTEDHSDELRAARVCPPMRRRLSRVRLVGAPAALRQRATHIGFNADRLFNRFWDYPQWLRRHRREFDLFHLVDHSYAQLVHEIPAGRAVVTCHDLDTFRSVLDPLKDPRGRLFRAMVTRILRGLEKAARVVCPTAAIRDELVSYDLVPAERVVVVPNGVHPSCSPRTGGEDSRVEELLGSPRAGDPVLLHVGSTIARKRIDVLLRVFAGVRKEVPGAMLVRVGGPFTPAQAELAEQLGVAGAIRVMPRLDRSTLGAVYRRADLVLQPSDAEGFGLPVAEALASGTPVVASDLEVLREVGGAATTFCPVADVAAWKRAVVHHLREREVDPERWSARRAAGLAQAAQFSWTEYARQMVELYREVLAEAA